MLKLRVATAVVLLLILWFAIWAGPLAFAGVMAICFGLVLYEWLRIGNLGPVPAALIAAIEMISQFSLYWAQALPKMDWFLFIVNGGVMVAWGVIFFAELFHRYNGFKVNVLTCLTTAVIFVPSAYLSLLWLYEAGSWVLVLCGVQTSALISVAAPGASIRCVRRFRPTRPGKARSAPT